MGFGDKIPYEFVQVLHAVGNSANAAVCASRLGLKTALVTQLGDDQNGMDCVKVLSNENVVTDFVSQQENKETNYHFVLWFEDDRTILIKHNSYERTFPDIGEPKWVYFTSVGSDAGKYQEQVIDYLEAHPTIKMAFQPGTFQIALGLENMSRFYKRAELLAVNKKEAKKILNTDSDDFRFLLGKLASYGPKMVLITDGEKGAYFYSGDKKYFMPTYPDPKPPYERTGAGDSFTATLVSMLIKGMTPEEALLHAPVNSMSVVQQIGAQKGLLSFEDLNSKFKAAPPDYRFEILN
jgi:sugar/nucleoside kinase (ribokinase family)